MTNAWYKVKIKKKLKLILDEEDALALVKIIDRYKGFCEENPPKGVHNFDSEVQFMNRMREAVVTMAATNRSINCG